MFLNRFVGDGMRFQLRSITFDHQRATPYAENRKFSGRAMHYFRQKQKSGSFVERQRMCSVGLTGCIFKIDLASATSECLEFSSEFQPSQAEYSTIPHVSSPLTRFMLPWEPRNFMTKPGIRRSFALRIS
jgi:hypothetical protein